MRIAHDISYARKCGQLFGSALGVAPGDDDASGGACGMNFADGIASLGVCSCGDGAGVQDDHVGGIWRTCDSAATVEELAFNGGAVGLSGTAAELFDVEGGHCFIRIAKTRKPGPARRVWWRRIPINSSGIKLAPAGRPPLQK